MNRKTLSLLLLVALFAFGCAKPTSPNPNPPTSETPSAHADAQYIVLDKLFMGSYDQDGWHDASEQTFYAAQLAAKDSYRLYTEDKFLGTAYTLIWYADESAIFSPTHTIDDAPAMTEALAALTSPAAQGETIAVPSGFYPVVLPADLTQTALAELTMPADNSYCYFPTADTFDPAQDPVVLALSAPHDALPHSLTAKQTLDDTLATQAKDELTALALPDAPLWPAEYFTGDFDGDGATEDLAILQTPLTEAGYPLTDSAELQGQSGAYQLVYYWDRDQKDEAQLIYHWSAPYPAPSAQEAIISDISFSRRLTFLGAYDLNGDGTLEVALKDSCWEGGETRVYALDQDGRYQPVLTGRW